MPVVPENTAEPAEASPSTEPPIETETSTCMDYQAQRLRDKYRLLSDSRCGDTNSKMDIREFDIVAQRIGGVGISVSLPMAHLRSRHQEAYPAHVTSHKRPNHDCIERGYSIINAEGKSVMERMGHTRTRLQFEGRSNPIRQKSDDSLSVSSSKRPGVPQLGHFLLYAPKGKVGSQQVRSHQISLKVTIRAIFTA